MKKAIGIIRTSTDRQDVDVQKRELSAYIIQDGYSESDILWIGDKGISAIKENEAYDEMYRQLYSCLDSGAAECVYAWELSRIGRREEPVIRLKNYLIRHRIQLRIMNPGLYLLNPDGAVNGGMELALTLFITMSKQEMENKKARFRRAKDAMKAKGEYTGGKIRFGWRVEDKKFIQDPEEMKVVKAVYSRYATGKYSFSTLASEMYELGYRNRGRRITFSFINHLLREDEYYKDVLDGDVWSNARKVRLGAGSSIKSKERNIHLAQGILRCPVCGHNMTAHYNKSYTCPVHKTPRRFKGQECGNTDSILISVMDNVVLDTAVTIYKDVYERNKEEENQRLLLDILALQEKYDTLEKEYVTYEKKLERIQTMYIDGDITPKQYAMQKDRVNMRMRECKGRMDMYKADIQVKTDMNADDIDITDMSDKEKKQIVHKYIHNVTVCKERIDYRDKTYGGGRKQCGGTYPVFRITMHTVDGVKECVYRPRFGIFY